MSEKLPTIEIGKVIKVKRTLLKLIQEELAKKISVSRSTITNWELGRSYPDIQSIIDLSEILDVTLDDLLKGDVVTIGKLTNDTKDSQKLKLRKRQLLWMGLGLLSIGLFGFYKYDQAMKPLKQQNFENIKRLHHDIDVEQKIEEEKRIEKEVQRRLDQTMKK